MTTQALTIQDAPTLEETRERMKHRLGRFLPEAEITLKADLVFEINRLKRERNAVILGHNYMEAALYHTVPDYVGDSLELSRVSARTEADVIVFCGVKFMAETAKILNPSRTVLIPSLEAGCSLAAGVTADDVRQLKAWFPNAPVVTYVNTYADVKAVSDYCCTSGNAEKVIRHIMEQGHEQVIFLPDEFLAHNTAKELGLPFFKAEPGCDPAQAPANGIIGWEARCEVHDQFTVDDIRAVRKQFPDVTIVAHPECSPDVLAEVDAAGSTKQMIDFVDKSDADQLLLLTECAMGDNIAAEFPDKEILRLCSVRCPHMNTITLEETLASLRHLQYQIELPERTINEARTAIDRMLEIS